MAYLRHYVNGSVVSIYEIKGTVTIGRHPHCNISIDEPTISGRHAQLRVAAASCELIDLDSTNGVRVSGEKVSRALLCNGQLFSLGTHEFEFLLAIPNDLDKTLKIKKSWIPGVYFTE